jgi:hypothetical protein
MHSLDTYGKSQTFCKAEIWRAKALGKD